MLPSHVGLGHVARDLAVVRALRKASPRVGVEWLTAEPALTYLRLWGEDVLECSEDLKSFSKAIEWVFNAGGFNLNVLRGYLRMLKHNYSVLRECVCLDDYDLVFADEFWELMLEAQPEDLGNVIFATDLVFMPYGRGLKPFVISLLLNRYFIRSYLKFRRRVYLNSLYETPNCRWFWLWGCRVRDWVRRNMFVTGLVTSYLPWELPSRDDVREGFGVGESPFIVASVGRTSARSSEMLSKVIKAVRRVRESLSCDVRLAIVKGSRTVFVVEEGVDEWVRSYGLLKSMLNLYMPADAFIVRSGRTTAADLECLPRAVRAILIPIKGHMEQEHIAEAVASRFPNSFKVVSENVSVGDLAVAIAEMLGRRSEGRRACSKDMLARSECDGTLKTVNYILNALGLAGTA